MNNSLSIKFYLHLSKGNGVKSPIYLRLIYNRVKAEISTDYKIDNNLWDESSQRVKRNAVINAGLNQLETKVYDILKDLKSLNEAFTVQDIKDSITGKNDKADFLIGYAKTFLDRKASAGECDPETVQKYQTTVEFISQFIKKKYGKDDHLLSKVDYTFVQDLDVFLLNVDTRSISKRMGRNTANKHHTRFKSILISANKEGIINKMPYRDFALKNTPTTRTFLTQEELDILATHDLGGNKSLDKVRDIFVFSVYTGLRFQDAQDLTMENIRKNADGNLFLDIEQGKTDGQVLIPVLNHAKDIVTKYEGDERKVTGKVLPRISNVKVNLYLKTIADLIGIDKHHTHHMARHTCATTVLLSNEVPIEAVSRWLGHSSIKHTQVYAKITNEYLMKIGQRLEEKLK